MQIPQASSYVWWSEAPNAISYSMMGHLRKAWCAKVGALGILLLLITLGFARSDDVPFAAPPSQQSLMETPVHPSLGDLMVLTQMRHIKLWSAGKAQNWQLVLFELTKIEETLHEAAVRYLNIPVELVVNANRSLAAMREAAEKQSAGGFMRSYIELTAACNTCHTAGEIKFIRIQVPSSSPFSDQFFEVPVKP